MAAVMALYIVHHVSQRALNTSRCRVKIDSSQPTLIATGDHRHFLFYQSFWYNDHDCMPMFAYRASASSQKRRSLRRFSNSIYSGSR